MANQSVNTAVILMLILSIMLMAICTVLGSTLDLSGTGTAKSLSSVDTERITSMGQISTGKPSRLKCMVGPTQTYRCHNNVAERLYRNADCSEEWQTACECGSDRACVGGVCIRIEANSTGHQDGCDSAACRGLSRWIGVPFANASDERTYQKFMDCRCTKSVCECRSIDKKVEEKRIPDPSSRTIKDTAVENGPLRQGSKGPAIIRESVATPSSKTKAKADEPLLNWRFDYGMEGWKSTGRGCADLAENASWKKSWYGASGIVIISACELCGKAPVDGFGINITAMLPKNTQKLKVKLQGCDRETEVKLQLIDSKGKHILAEIILAKKEKKTILVDIARWQEKSVILEVKALVLGTGGCSEVLGIDSIEVQAEKAISAA